MNKQQEHKMIRDSVLGKIRRGEIRKLPRYIFSAKGVLLILAVALAGAFLAFVGSFLIFALQTSGLWDLPRFGFTGIEVLVSNFPWFIVVLALLFIVVLEALVAHYNFVYRRPLLYSALFIGLLVALISLGVRYTMLHEKIYSSAEGGTLPEVRLLYERYAKPNPEQFHPGTVSALTEHGFTLEQQDHSLVPVHVLSTTRMKEGFRIYPGGRLLVVGRIVDGVIEADIIDNAPPTGRP